METLTYLDTHVVAWLYAGRLELLGQRARRVLEQHELLISPMVLVELEYLREIKRLTVGANCIVRALRAQIGLNVCTLPFPSVVESAIEQQWTRDPFDRLIVGQAAVAGCPLVTKDAIIRRHYRHVIW
jgi:PIN domain nuclease of toxin-antitoxin system